MLGEFFDESKSRSETPRPSEILYVGDGNTCILMLVRQSRPWPFVTRVRGRGARVSEIVSSTIQLYIETRLLSILDVSCRAKCRDILQLFSLPPPFFLLIQHELYTYSDVASTRNVAMTNWYACSRCALLSRIALWNSPRVIGLVNICPSYCTMYKFLSNTYFYFYFVSLFGHTRQPHVISLDAREFFFFFFRFSNGKYTQIAQRKKNIFSACPRVHRYRESTLRISIGPRRTVSRVIYTDDEWRNGERCEDREDCVANYPDFVLL